MFKANEVPISLVMAVVAYGGAPFLTASASTDTSQIMWHCGFVFWHYISSHLGNSWMDSMHLVSFYLSLL